MLVGMQRRMNEAANEIEKKDEEPQPRKQEPAKRNPLMEKFKQRMIEKIEQQAAADQVKIPTPEPEVVEEEAPPP